MSEYRDSFSETGWTRLAKALSASFRLGRFFRVEVRVFWLTLLVMPLILMRTVEGLSFGQGLSWIVAVTVLLYVVIWSHEMGHILAGRRYGIQTPLITLSPLGGLAHMSAAAPSPAKEAIIAGAGPFVHVLWLAVLFPLHLWLPEPGQGGWVYPMALALVDSFVTLNLWLMVFNLLPFFPMDGGRILRAFLAGRVHPNRATILAARIGMGGAVAFMLVGAVLWISDSENLWGVILVVIGLSNLGACRREIQMSRYSAGPYGTGDTFAPWQNDPEAWKSGDDDEATGALGTPGFLARKREQRAERQQKQDALANEKLDAEVDRVLARVSQVGMDGLSAAERRILEKASNRRRGD